MSHELRTPINAVLGYSTLLLENIYGPLNDKQTEGIQRTQRAAKHLLELVNDVLDLSKIEAGRMELVYDSFRVASAFNEVRNVIRSLSERRGLILESDIHPEDLEIRADKSKFKQVLYNLLSNAIKFTPSGGRVWVRAREQDHDLEMEVGDTGIGIAAEHQDRIFTEFFQVDPRQHQGTGLGLSLTRRLIQLHGGVISLQSEPGHGSVFTFRLPIDGLDGQDAHAQSRILLIEDNASNRELTKMVLNGNGYQVDVATDGPEGLEKARSNLYDLVLMDVRLPGMDGLTLTRMLKSDPKTAQIPVVALSAHAMKGDEQKALAAGCSAYITKPIEVAQFVQQISNFLEAGAQ
jgi:CheY-like chemotaxis protein